MDPALAGTGGPSQPAREAGSGTWSLEHDPWRKRAVDIEKSSRDQAAETNPIQELILSSLRPENTVLDIGAGTGRWTRLLARYVKKITAIDPSPAMLTILKENVVRETLSNVDIIEGFWPEIEVEPHDFTLCAHAMYSAQDFPRFINRLIEVSRCRCYLLIRMPVVRGIMGDAFQQVYGQPNDSPNFMIAYNALLQMGIHANVLMGADFPITTSQSMEEALGRAKQRLGLIQDTGHDHYLEELLRKKLIISNDLYIWPDRMRSVLVYWDVDA